MHPIVAENLELLWAREPALAGRVRAQLRSGTAASSPILPDEEPLDTDRWIDQLAAGGFDGGVTVLFGLGPHALRLKARMGDRPLWVVDPSLPTLLRLMERESLLPLLLRGRLLVGDTIQASISTLCRQRNLRLARHPGRHRAEAAWFVELEEGLRRRAAQVAAVRQRNLAAALVAKAGPGSELGQLLQMLPPSDQVTVEGILQAVKRSKRKWGKAERLFAIMDSCRL